MSVPDIRAAFEAGMYPSQIGVFCDKCGTVHEADYLVPETSTQPERFEVARAHLRTQGWSCTPGGDLCPACAPKGTSA